MHKANYSTAAVRRGPNLASLLGILALMVLSACATPQPGQQATVRPLHIVGYSDYFPRVVGPFVRTTIAAYGVGMEDVSIGYNTTVGQQPSATTLYLYPVYSPQTDAGATLELEFDEVKSAMAHFADGRWITSRARAVVEQPSGSVDGLTATYSYRIAYQGQPVELLTVVHLFLEGDRFIKFRHTYPAVDADFYRTVTEDLMSSLRWQGTTEQNLEARLGQAS